MVKDYEFGEIVEGEQKKEEKESISVPDDVFGNPLHIWVFSSGV